MTARVRALWRLLRGRSVFDREVDEEFRLHLELRAEDLVRAGVAPAEAARRARLEFGGVERYKEEARRARGLWPLNELWRDARYAVRGLGRSPGFAAAAVLTLGLGIGAATTIYGIFDAAYLRALPYPASDRLVAVWQDHGGRDGPAKERFNPPDFAVLRERGRMLESVAAAMGWSPTVTGTSRPERLSGASVSHEYFALFGGRPLVGRFFVSGDETPAGAERVVLGHGLWRRRFGGDPGVVGRTIELDGDAHTIIGVAGAGFRPPGGEAEIWRPLRSDPGGFARMFRVLDVVGRLAPGATVAGARVELDGIAARIAGEFPRFNDGVAFRVAPLAERVLGPVRAALFALVGAVALILAIACANVAGLFLARGAARGRDVAVRAALGARRGRLVREFLVEGVVLGLAGGVVGVALAAAGMRVVAAVLPAGALPGARATLHPGIVAGALVLSLATAVAVVLVPALRLSGVDLARTLRGAGGPQATRGSARARSALVAAELALSLVLLAGAALFLRSFTALVAIDPGFRAEGVLTAEISLPRDRYPDATTVSGFYRALLEDLRRRPGVRSAGATSLLPLRGGDNDVSFRIEGRATADVAGAVGTAGAGGAVGITSPTGAAGAAGARGARTGHPATAGAESSALAWYRMATPGYFRAMGIPLLRGRAFTVGDVEGAAGVVIVNETLARRYWPDRDPIRQRLSPEWAEGAWLTVVGVVGDVRHNGLTEGAVPELYFPHAQAAGAARTMAVVVRTTSAPVDFAASLGAAVRSLDPDLPLERVAAMDRVLGRSLVFPRLHLWTFGLFAGLALLLAAVGLYGVASTVVAQRTREIGVRMAIGARPADVVGSVLAWLARLALIGTGIGLIAALALSRTLRGLLFGPAPADPSVFVGVVAVVGTVVVLAAIVPARRAARVDPMVALRAE